MDLKEEMWKLAVLTAMVRVGLLALQHDECGNWIPPTAEVAAYPEATRAARRKYRKLWRRALARDLRDFDRMPRRRQKRYYSFTFTYVKGAYRSKEGPLEGMMLKLLAHDVGRRPRKNARGARWDLVKQCPELRKELLKVAAEFGLLDEKRNM